ncbi:cytochrome P450 [Sphingomonas sp. KR1UV-12]|uniref:Cytochrome P450 n=1 Tax=Sphingomonas aurea TaxID=3063994 RepID=A0ABT9EIU4_9SPHN|nr:cytochrome P450 [Sphingomonas sp. KR1UV-12]MDP1026880.1 cytochrome P450 [Sphingomonas sp. KR1UV-12]
MATVAAADLKDPGLYEAGVPWDEFAALRREDPVHWNPEADGAGFWAVTRHADIVEVSRQPQLFSSAYENGGHRIFNENEVGLTGAGDSAIGIPFISRDPPIHTRYRKFVMPALSPGRLGDIEVRIRDRVRRLVDEIPLGDSVNLVPALSAPLPLMTLAELLGVSIDMWPKLYDWTNAFVGEDDPEFRQSPVAMAATLGEFFEFAQELFQARRAEPTGDIASLLANAEIDGEAVPFRDFVANLILVLVGGNETTRNSLSHTVAAFSANPDQWDAIRADRDVLKTAAPEMVRFASPVMHMRRTAMEDTTVGGRAVRKGDKVVLWYISANRDEDVFPDADRFLVTRKGAQHVGFGAGQHVCVGSRLAEMQLRIAFDLLADRVTSFEVQAPPRRFRSNFINGLKNLDVIMRPA